MAGIPNPLSNSLEFARQWTDRVVKYLPKDTPGQVQQGIKNFGEFAQKVGDRLEGRLSQSDFGTQMYGTRLRPEQREYVQEQRKQTIDDIRFADNPLKEAGKKLKENFDPVKIASDVTGNVALTKQAQLTANRFTNAYRIASDAGVKASQAVGVDSNLSKAAIAAGVPLLYMSLSGQMGSPLDGFRPKGQKAVAPVSKDEDPSGATPRNIIEEGALRTFAFQRGQMLPFKEFIKERPDVMPSTIAEYRRYVNLKPQAGNRIDIDRDKKTFTAFGGLIKGTARGLNDPEIRIKGAPITASSVLGIGAGLGTIAAAKKYLDPSGLGISNMKPAMASDITPDTSQGSGLKTHEEIASRFTSKGQVPQQGPLQNIPENRRERGVERVVGYVPRVGKDGMVEDSGEPKYYAPRPNENTPVRMKNVKLQDKLRDLRQQRDILDASEKSVKQEQLNIPRLSGLGDSRTQGQKAQEERTRIQKEIDDIVDKSKKYGKPKLDKDNNPIPDTAKLGKAGQAFQDAFARRPDLKEPAILLGGTVAALGTAAVAKKLFQKAQEKRIKKEDPVQYEKYKRGDYTK